MNARERFVRTLSGQEVDRVPFMKIFGGANATLPRWREERPGIENEIDELLGFEGSFRGWAKTRVNVDLAGVGEPEVIERTEGHVVRRFSTGKLEMVQRGGDYGRHTIDWPITCRSDWERLRDVHLDPEDPTRFPNDWAADVEAYRARDYPLQLTHRGVYGFPREQIGDENLAYMFYDEPDLVHEIIAGYTDMAIAVWKKMVAEVEFDLIECWEDICFRSGSLVSPAIFREFLKPHYERIVAFAREHGIPLVLIDSDGRTDELTGLMAESGVNSMYPYEVGAGNDVPAVRRAHPEFGCIGCLDKECMARGCDAIDAEIERARELIRRGRVIPGPDHFVLSNVPLENYLYFMERLREVVMTTRPEQG